MATTSSQDEADLVDVTKMPYLQAQNFVLAWYLAVRELKIEQASTYLGLIWWVATPILNTLLFYFMITKVFHVREENYAAFLVVGLMTWRGIQSMTTSIGRAIDGNLALHRDFYIPKYVFVLKEFLVSGMKQIAAFLVLFFILWFILGHWPGRAYVYLPALLVILSVVTIACGAVLALLNAFLPDMRKVVPMLFTGTMYLSGVIWPPERLPDGWRFLIDWNPFALLVHAFRDVLLDNRAPDLLTLLPWTLLFLAIGYGAYTVMKRFEGQFTRIIV